LVMIGQEMASFEIQDRGSRHLDFWPLSIFDIMCTKLKPQHFHQTMG